MKCSSSLNPTTVTMKIQYFQEVVRWSNQQMADCIVTTDFWVCRDVLEWIRNHVTNLSSIPLLLYVSSDHGMTKGLLMQGLGEDVQPEWICLLHTNGNVSSLGGKCNGHVSAAAAAAAAVAASDVTVLHFLKTQQWKFLAKDLTIWVMDNNLMHLNHLAKCLACDGYVNVRLFTVDPPSRNKPRKPYSAPRKVTFAKEAQLFCYESLPYVEDCCGHRRMASFFTARCMMLCLLMIASAVVLAGMYLQC